MAEAVDGAEAVDFYKQHNPEILLLDLAMPKKDGLEVVHDVTAFDSNTKIILVTTGDDQKITNQCLSSGTTSYISKPLDFNSVLKVLSNISGNDN
ncbi:response regulator [Nitrosopumilus sp. b2]|uniref:response regulator n=1 Tax=Nitrosopumilus sp. b2 TaxID=2109908 RepID=UPI0021031827|nr:response regulator [Nitrosopumilus sp. b2]